MGYSSQQPNTSSYPVPVQTILQRLRQHHGNDAALLAIQALETFASSQPPVLTEPTRSLLIMAYQQTCRQTGQEWVHQAQLYTALRTLDPDFTYKPSYSTWPKFLQAYPTLFETQILHEQLHVRLKQ